VIVHAGMAVCGCGRVLALHAQGPAFTPIGRCSASKNVAMAFVHLAGALRLHTCVLLELLPSNILLLLPLPAPTCCVNRIFPSTRMMPYASARHESSWKIALWPERDLDAVHTTLPGRLRPAPSDHPHVEVGSPTWPLLFGLQGVQQGDCPHGQACGGGSAVTVAGARKHYVWHGDSVK